MIRKTRSNFEPEDLQRNTTSPRYVDDRGFQHVTEFPFNLKHDLDMPKCIFQSSPTSSVQTQWTTVTS